MAIDWTHRIRLRHLKIIQTLAHTGNISLTAQNLNMTQPGISRWLKELEDDIGLTLFERHARGLRLTAHGEILLEHAERILAQLDITRDDLLAHHHDGSGLVNIGCTGAATVDTAPMAVLELIKRLPKSKISILEGTMDRLIQKLNQGQLDIVLGRSAPDLLGDAIASESLYMEPLRIIASPQHPLAKQHVVTWTQLHQFRWIIWPKNTPIRQDLERALIADQQQLPKDYIESNSVLLNTTLLNQSDYIGIASARTANRLCQLGAITTLNIALAGFGSVSVFWRKDSLARLAVAQALLAIRTITQNYNDNQ